MVLDLSCVLQVWELNEGVLLYQSTIISSSPFISIAMHPLQQHFCIGTADGYVSDEL